MTEHEHQKTTGRVDGGASQVHEAFDRANERGYFGEVPDPTPNEAYTVGGVTSGAPTPETDEDLREEAAKRAQEVGEIVAPSDPPENRRSARRAAKAKEQGGMSEKAPRVETIEAIDPGFAITVDDTIIIGEAPFAGTVTAVTYTADAAITGAASNHRALRLINRGQAGIGTTIIAELAFDNGINAVAGDELAITLSATVANRVVAAGDVLALFSEAVGTGLVDPGGLLSVEISRS